MKKNVKKIPSSIRAAITNLAVDDVVVACVRRIHAADVSAYRHLGIRIENGALVIPPAVIPPATRGKYSKANINGKVRTRRDLPKISRTFTIQAPNWGGHGTHDVDRTVGVYRRDLIPPKELTISAQLLDQDPNRAWFIVKFAVDQVLSRAAPDFEDDLLYGLNLMQENVGAAMLFHSLTTLAEYANTIRVTWEILPLGTIDETLRRMLAGKPPVSREKQDVMRERLGVLANLNPERYIAGTTGFLRYFGAQFREDFVAFENIEYGNALYVMFEQWSVLSQRSRVDLLKGPRDGFERIVHASGWAVRLESTLRHYRENRRRAG